MKAAVIDFSKFDDPRNVHAYLKETLSFPDYYGGNLDALYDCLTDIGEDTEILTASSGSGYESGFMQVLRDASLKNHHLRIRKKPKNRRDSRKHT